MPKVKVKGGDQVLRRLEQLVRRMPKEVARALYQEAEIEMTEAKERTPVDTGALRASGHVDKPKIAGKKISVELAFGGPSAPYAVYVHEDLDAHHPVGQAKFLESTLNESAPFMAGRIARRVDLNKVT